MRQPHFVLEYKRLVKALAKRDPSTAMERAVGGQFLEMGAVQAKLLRETGLEDAQLLMDVGCGSGRTAFALRDLPIRYHGTDVVPELLDHARHKVGRSDWRFTLVNNLVIPQPDRTVDMVAMFSVITHLDPPETREYLSEVRRVLKSGGCAIVSFLDPDVAHHRSVAGGRWTQLVARWLGRSVKNVLTEKGQLHHWCADLGLVTKFFGSERLGQSYVVLTKP